MSTSTPDLVRALVAIMPESEQAQVLEYARSLAQAKMPPGTPIEHLLSFTGKLAPEVAEEMAQALNDTERIEADGNDLSL